MKNKETQFKDREGNIILIGTRMYIAPSWSIEDLYCKVVDEFTIKWEKQTTLQTSLAYWAKYLTKA